MKSKKLKLKELRIKSFVTEGDENTAMTIKGGIAREGSIIKSLSCGPTPGTWCYICPQEITREEF